MENERKRIIRTLHDINIHCIVANPLELNGAFSGSIYVSGIDVFDGIKLFIKAVTCRWIASGTDDNCQYWIEMVGQKYQSA